jgi:hypothetical protein
MAEPNAFCAGKTIPLRLSNHGVARRLILAKINFTEFSVYHLVHDCAQLSHIGEDGTTICIKSAHIDSLW